MFRDHGQTGNWDHGIYRLDRVWLGLVTDACPDLKTNGHSLELLAELSSIEIELQGSRRYDNATVRDLDTRTQSVPGIFLARPMGFTEEPFYQDDDPAIQAAPKVSFGSPAGA